MIFGCWAGYQGWDCSVNWIIMVLIFFIAAIVRKQLFDNVLDMEFNLWGAAGLGEVLFFVMLFILPLKFAFLIALGGILIGGIFAGRFFGGGGDGGEFE